MGGTDGWSGSVPPASDGSVGPWSGGVVLVGGEGSTGSSGGGSGDDGGAVGVVLGDVGDGVPGGEGDVDGGGGVDEDVVLGGGVDEDVVLGSGDVVVLVGEVEDGVDVGEDVDGLVPARSGSGSARVTPVPTGLSGTGCSSGEG